MKQLTILGFTFLLLLNYSCTKESSSSTPSGKITFWISRDNGCGYVDVSIDSTSVGQITNWQAIAPSSCTASKISLTVTTKRGKKSVTFKNVCGTATVSIDLNSDCLVYKVF
ncbi:MAG: hypothetical protein V4538_07575 [Bacteroidota bacterium]